MNSSTGIPRMFEWCIVIRFWELQVNYRHLVVRLERRTTEDCSFRRIMRLVPVFILETHTEPDEQQMFAQIGNASSSIKTIIPPKRTVGFSCCSIMRNIYIFISCSFFFFTLIERRMHTKKFISLFHCMRSLDEESVLYMSVKNSHIWGITERFRFTFTVNGKGLICVYVPKIITNFFWE